MPCVTTSGNHEPSVLDIGEVAWLKAVGFANFIFDVFFWSENVRLHLMTELFQASCSPFEDGYPPACRGHQNTGTQQRLDFSFEATFRISGFCYLLEELLELQVPELCRILLCCIMTQRIVILTRIRGQQLPPILIWFSSLQLEVDETKSENTYQGCAAAKRKFLSMWR